MICPKCGAEIRKGTAFCTACGGALKKASPRQGRRAIPVWSRVVAGVAGLVLIGLVVVIARWSASGDTRTNPTAPQPTARPVSLAVRGVASKFLCSCGECGERELADCTCATAVEGREFIDREMERGTPERKLIEMVNGRYGHIKPQYASMLSGPGDRPVEASATPPAPAKPSGGIATEADASWIASRFVCPCGQCQDHALSECNCKHPKGATEIKAFIQYKISQKRHTAEEIVKAVAGEYGHQVKG